MTTQLNIHEYSFAYVCLISPVKITNGEAQHFFPQERYANTRNLQLHKYGNGPFCQLKIPCNLSSPGVYLITFYEDIVYIGECQDLSSRFNAGYGNISPRNCFEGGQRTNCRINSLLLQATEENRQIKLWFYQTQNRKEVESKLIFRLRPTWNIQNR